MTATLKEIFRSSRIVFNISICSFSGGLTRGIFSPVGVLCLVLNGLVLTIATNVPDSLPVDLNLFNLDVFFLIYGLDILNLLHYSYETE